MGNFIIALYTGTGNTLYVAKQFPGAQIYFIDDLLSGKKTLLDDMDKLGIFFPVYYGSYPPMVEKFVQNILGRRDNTKLEYLFVVNTAFKSNRVANYSLERVLFNNGLGLSYAASLRFPSANLKHNKKQLSEMKTLAAANQKEIQIENIVKETENREIKIPKYVPFAFFVNMIAKNRNTPSKQTGLTISEQCNGCGICAKICPMGNISIREGKASYGDCCTRCYACYHRCPEKAIVYKKKTIGQYSGLVDTKELYRR